MASEFIAHIIDQLDQSSIKDQLSKFELPNSKNEAWKYTSLTQLSKEHYKVTPKQNLVSSLPTDLQQQLDIEHKAMYIIFYNGCFLSSKGIVVEPIEETNENIDIKDVFDGLRKIDEEYSIRFSKSFDNKQDALYVYHITDSSIPLLIQDQLKIEVDQNVHVKIVETTIVQGNANQLINNKTTIQLNKDASCEHYRIHNGENKNAFIIDNQYIAQKQQSNYRDFVLDIGFGKVRNNLQLDIKESHCDNYLYGLYVLNENEHVDNFSLINHFVADCQSNQLYKGVLGGKSTGIFSGKIIVHPDAQKTNAFQSNRNLLISDDATANSKPQLEIFADDVKCSHGATASQLEKGPLFYLRSRGIAQDKAEALLTFAFAAEIIEKIKVDNVRQLIEQMVNIKLNIES